MLITLVILLSVILGGTGVYLKKRNAPKLIVGDKTWDGTFPCEAPEFHGVAYVYKDGVESPVVRFDVPILGYRVAPKMIVSIGFGFDLSSSEALNLATEKHMRLPNVQELKVVVENRNLIDEMKDVIDDVYLPDDFWVISEGKPQIYSAERKTLIKENNRTLYADAILIIDR